MGALHDLCERYRDTVSFVVVYVREAHPEDGWVVTGNRDEEIIVNDPSNNAERLEIATTCALGLEINMPVVVDGIDDAVCRAYGGFPDRLALVAEGGRLAYISGVGPMGFLPDELEAAIRDSEASAPPG